MYVRYMVPQGGDGSVPVGMVHGATLTGTSWETTPDGCMSWDEMKIALQISCALLFAVCVVRPFAAQLQQRLALELQDYAALPPADAGFFVNDLTQGRLITN